LVGVHPKGNETKLYTLPLHFGKVLIGSHGGEAIPDKDIPKYVSLINNGKLELNQLITEHYSLEEINDAIGDMRHGKIAGRCMIRMTNDEFLVHKDK